MSQERIDWNAVERGLVSWSVDECYETMEWYANLKDTPKDDWDLSWDYGFNLLDEASGREQQVRFNPFVALNQLGRYMTEKYPPEIRGYHLMRFSRIQEFFREHHKDLRDDGFARECEDGSEDVRESVLEALCTLPFAEERDAGQGQVYHAFCYSDVLATARQIDATKEDGKSSKGDSGSAEDPE